MFCKSGRIFAGPWENVQQATKLNCSNSSQLLEMMKMKERSFIRKHTFLFELVDKYFHYCHHRER
jgi:hypothetical protein